MKRFVSLFVLALAWPALAEEIPRAVVSARPSLTVVTFPIVFTNSALERRRHQVVEKCEASGGHIVGEVQRPSHRHFIGLCVHGSRLPADLRIVYGSYRTHFWTSSTLASREAKQNDLAADCNPGSLFGAWFEDEINSENRLLARICVSPALAPLR